MQYDMAIQNRIYFYSSVECETIRMLIKHMVNHTVNYLDIMAFEDKKKLTGALTTSPYLWQVSVNQETGDKLG